MPTVDLKVYAEMPPVELEARRVALVKKANGSHDNLTLEDLHELAAVTGVLRRKASGPPKEAKTKGTSPKRAKAQPATIDDLA